MYIQVQQVYQEWVIKMNNYAYSAEMLHVLRIKQWKQYFGQTYIIQMENVLNGSKDKHKSIILYRRITLYFEYFRCCSIWTLKSYYTWWVKVTPCRIPIRNLIFYNLKVRCVLTEFSRLLSVPILIVIDVNYITFNQAQHNIILIIIGSYQVNGWRICVLLNETHF